MIYLKTLANKPSVDPILNQVSISMQGQLKDPVPDDAKKILNKCQKHGVYYSPETKWLSQKI